MTRSTKNRLAVCVIAVAAVVVVMAQPRAAAAQTRPGAATSHRSMTPVAGHAVPLITAGVVALATGVTLYAAPTGQANPAADHWRGGILFDDAARSALRFNTPGGRAAADTVSGMAMVSTMLLATSDAVAVPLAQGDVDLSWQAGFAYSLSLGVTLSVGEIFKRTVGRARPYEQNCAADPSGPGCGTADAYGSFYSLHTSVAFTSAGFSCAMHLSRGLYGDGLADGTSCALSLSLATLTGVMRIAADDHYLSDVLVGGIIGFIIGYLVPLWLVPDRQADGAVAQHHPDVSASIMPMVSPGPGGGTYGLSVVGTF